ncbi:DUF916 and DUF3324 domain-containing protein [Lacticaseibacillus kribbianus]|uniref:DUF916 and DUF3324 domain-containing protein n=1 Tax=Lacticaseibacillus kribbianus TaxID=2926292 RepID=UPI001CD54BBA|nr:DUF916 and DUF3324 domain-containing protein [Lacticaseibacillus kribbianus]
MTTIINRTRRGSRAARVLRATLRGLAGGLLLVMAALLLTAPRPARAAGAGFTVSPVSPAAAMEKGYFVVQAAPGSTRKLVVAVANLADAPKNLRLQVTDAFTQPNGEVGYTPGGTTDPAAKYQLSKLSSPPVDFTLAAHQGREVTITVALPPAAFDGQILGGIYVEDLADYGGSGSGMAVANHFAMMVAIQMQNSPKLVAPHLNLGQVTVGTQDNAPAVLATLQNDRARLFGKLAITAKVTPAGKTKATVTRSVTNYAMAPTSHLDFGLPLTTALAPGQYDLDLLAVAGDYRWHFTRRFTVTAKQAATTAKAVVPDAVPVWPWLSIAGVVLLLGLLWLVLWRRRRRKKDDPT